MWCPAIGCANIIEKSEYTLESTVRCSCNSMYCFHCKKEEHVPASCKYLELWLEKEKADSENLTWLKANTKPCPKCQCNVEKNQGCNQMICSKCKHSYCWLCQQDWSTHGGKTGGYYACNIFEEKKKSDKNFVSE